jgi:hypothetical protein
LGVNATLSQVLRGVRQHGKFLNRQQQRFSRRESTGMGVCLLQWIIHKNSAVISLQKGDPS